MNARVALAVLVAALLSAAPALAADPPDAGPTRAWASCTEHVPEGAARPKIEEVFPQRGFSGYAATLEITVTHGKGETVLPEGLKVHGGSDAAKALGLAGFVIPEPDGGSGPTLTTTPGEAASVTKLIIPFVPLPKEGGRNGMVLPPVPIAVARASGDVMTMCTKSHAIVVDDPIANELDPKVKPNPPPRVQREDWVLARQLAIGLAAGAFIGAIAAWMLRSWLRRPKIVPPPPPRIPWLIALDELDVIRRSTLLEDGRGAEYFDRVSDCVRNYLGARYGFDGLETTTDEMRAILKRMRPGVPGLKKIGTFLADCDLVKFARALPDDDDCREALRLGEEIVRTTMPLNALAPAADGEGPPAEGAPA